MTFRNHVLKEPRNFVIGEMAWSPFVGWAYCEGSTQKDFPIAHGRPTTNYTIEGRVKTYDKFPVLLHEDEAVMLGHTKPVRLVRKTVRFWSNIKPNSVPPGYKSREEALKFAGPDDIQIELSGEYSIEE